MAAGIKSDRIDGIDALRAFALLGILLVHAVESFGFIEDSLIANGADRFIAFIIKNLFLSKSNAIFSLLFGCSFWFILRNPGYGSLRFVWRCLLLAVIGLVAKIFYTFDILMWYGLCGALLVLFRHCKVRALLVISVALILLSSCLEMLDLGTALLPAGVPDRYVTGYSLAQVVDYPLWDSVRCCFVAQLDKLSVRTLGMMMLGYWIGRSGYLTRWREVATWRLTAVFAVAFAVSHVVMLAVRGDGSSLLFHLSGTVAVVVQALFMSVLVVCVCRNAGRWIYPLACYGRLGLTNYFFQGVAGVALFSEWFIPCHVGLAANVSILLGFYVMQILFSVAWCRSHRYGPLEFLWRKVTNISLSRSRDAV